ncbi:MAG TPA: S9 family peptidase [Acidimicrobiales bacterium]|nr:S9 family peptidase [Acidimicrobiales bacterium]
MRPDDLGDLVDVGDPRVSPDGRHVAFVVTSPDLAANEYRSQVWVASIDGAVPAIPFTEGRARDARPRWSPDSESIAYVAHPDETGARLMVADVEGDAPLEIAAWPDDIDDLAWTPDGTRIVFTARARDEDRYAPSKDRDRPARRVDRLAYRLDSVGWTIDRPRHLFDIAADGSDDGVVRRLTDGPYEDAGIAITPDGSAIAFSAARTSTWDTDLATDIYRIGPSGGEPEPLTRGLESHTSPSWSPDGRHIAYVWTDRHSLSRNGQIGVIDLETGDRRLLTSTLDRNCAPYLMRAREPVWDAGGLLFQADDAGRFPLLRVGLDGTVVRVVGGDRMVTGFDAAGGTIAFVATSGDRLGDLYVLVEGRERRVTSFGESFARAHVVASPERFTATSADGTPIDAWIVRPPAADPGERYPMLLNIHGGPFSQYGDRFFDEFQVQAGAGYVVVYSNPRGSSGYGDAFGRAIRGPAAEHDPGTGWGSVDYADLMAVVDSAIDRYADVIDPERLGVIGGSYGGYMTTWIIGHTDRFRSACAERALTNMVTFSHTSDIASFFLPGYLGTSHLDDPDEYARQSPVTYFRLITTPLLLLHSENDLRCPVEQAEDLFVRLKSKGAQVEFVRFPGESHELSRSGSPRHRVERLRIILDWFARTL